MVSVPAVKHGQNKCDDFWPATEYRSAASVSKKVTHRFFQPSLKMNAKVFSQIFCLGNFFYSRLKIFKSLALPSLSGHSWIDVTDWHTAHSRRMEEYDDFGWHCFLHGNDLCVCNEGFCVRVFLGGCVVQRMHSCFPPSNPGFESQPRQYFFLFTASFVNSIETKPI